MNIFWRWLEWHEPTCGHGNEAIFVQFDNRARAALMSLAFLEDHLRRVDSALADIQQPRALERGKDVTP
jgi:hypothetical protein